MKIKLLLTILFISQLTYSQTKIEWLTSNPNNNEFYSISVIEDSLMYAVGHSGILVKSEDYGRSWISIEIFSESSARLRKVIFFDKQNGILLGDQFEEENSTIYFTEDGGNNWERSEFNSEVHLNDLIFIDDNNGIALGYDELYVTSDMGRTWRQRPLVFGYKYKKIKKMLNNNLLISGDAIISYGNRFLPPVVKGVILISKDNGDTWNIVNEFDEYVRNAYQLNDSVFIAACAQPNNSSGSVKNIYKSTDSGTTWTKQFSEFNYHTVSDILFTSENRGIITFSSGIQITKDGGVTWRTEYLDGTGVNSLFLDDKGVIYSAGGTIRKSENSGESWIYITKKDYGKKGSINIINDSTVYITGGTSVWKTTDGAKTWTDLWEDFSFQSASGSSFLNSKVGELINLSGGIFRTEDGGENWVSQNSDIPIWQNHIKMYNSEIGVIVGSRKDLPDTENGAALYTVDGGKNWNKSEINSGIVYCVDYSDKLTWFASSIDGTIFKSTDGGKKWDLNFKLNKSYLSEICFATKNIGYAGGSNGVILKTVDQGESWEELDFNLGEDIYISAIKFYGELFGVITTSDGIIFTTTDGGENWLKEKLGEQIYNIDIYKNTCYASGYFSLIRFRKEGNFVDEKRLPEDDGPDSLKNLNFIRLEQNFPNPFSHSTQIIYTLPDDAFVSLNIYNSLGQLVDTPLKEYSSKGEHSYNYTPLNLASGVYLYEIKSVSVKSIKKMIYIK